MYVYVSNKYHCYVYKNVMIDNVMHDVIRKYYTHTYTAEEH